MTQKNKMTQADKKEMPQEATPFMHYKAIVDCRFGGMHRRAGELFDHPQLSSVPPYLEEVFTTANATPSNESDEKTTYKIRSKKAPSLKQKKTQVGKEDIGLGRPTSVADLNSSDMIK